MATRNLGLIWLPRGLRPDFGTLADFRHAPRAAFRTAFLTFAMLWHKLDLSKRAARRGRHAAEGGEQTGTQRPRGKLARHPAAGDTRIGGCLAELDDIDRREDNSGPGRGDAFDAKIAGGASDGRLERR